ncbi:hypothetical protein BGZ70_003177 [Mortierella alpina]|uniref:Uncharacterized protein n=1 Tax=Mortierella alpina TaxID=64518 RepID=A0A9P6M542_MORAP|nr:hypothetical protein BGZ70_003177 [Mortierella alpina]
MDEFRQRMIHIICTNPALNTIFFDGCDQYPSSEFWKACLERLGELQGVTVRNVDIDNASLPWCWATLARARKISVISTRWGPTASGTMAKWPDPALRPIARSIDLRECLGVPVRNQWQFMAQCSEVEVVNAADCRPWVCTKIKSLRLLFDTRALDPRWANTLVFTQLARLHNIQALNISLKRRQYVDSTALSFRLDMGLNILAGLRDLRELYILNTRQNLRPEDAEWMAKYWSLSYVTRSLHPLEEDDDILCNIAMRGRQRQTPSQ